MRSRRCADFLDVLCNSERSACAGFTIVNKTGRFGSDVHDEGLNSALRRGGIPVIAHRWMAPAIATVLVGSTLAYIPTVAQAGESHKASTSSAKPAVKHTAPLQAPLAVRVTLGGGKALSGVTVTLRDSNGAVLATELANPSGVAFFDRKGLPSTLNASVSGGKVWEKLGRPDLQTPVTNTGRRTVVFLSPMTAVASMAAREGGIPMATAMLRAKAAMGVPAWASASQMGMVSQIFDPTSFQSYAAKNGGVKPALAKLAKAAASGEKAVDLAPMNFPKLTRQKNNRSGTSTALWVGQTVLKQVAGAGASYVIGNVFGQSNPDAGDFAAVESDLNTIITQLAGLQNSMNDLLALMSQSLLLDTQTQISTIVSNTTSQWDAYNTFLTDVDPTASDYEETTCGYANDFYNQVANNTGEWENLFSTTAEKGVIELMYDNITGVTTGTTPAPWWNSYNVASITGFIDYYGTLQAESQALADESFKFNGNCEDKVPYQHNESTDYITNHDGQATTLNNNIYLSMPTQIDGATVATPSNQMMYRAFNSYMNDTYHQYVRNDNSPLCTDTGNTAATQSWPTLKTDKSQWPGIWSSLLNSKTGGSWTMASSTIFPTLEKATLDANGNDMWALETLTANSSGSNGYLALISSESVPMSGYNHTSSDNKTHFDGWLFCDGNSVNIAKYHSNSTWETVFQLTGYNDTDPNQIALLSQQEGSFHYVAPASS